MYRYIHFMNRKRGGRRCPLVRETPTHHLDRDSCAEDPDFVLRPLERPFAPTAARRSARTRRPCCLIEVLMSAITKANGNLVHTSRVIVADGIPRPHAAHGAWRAEVSGAADLLGVLPNKLRVMTPRGETRHIRCGLSVIAGWEEVDLAVVPAIASRPGDRGFSANSFRIIRRTPHGKVLAVTTTADGT